jgi:predicted small lipoprotein YifL
MKKVLKLCVLVAFVIISLHATCGPKKPLIKEPVEVVKFKDKVYFHNMSITYDGTYYYTMNGGNEDYCLLNQYDVDGTLIEEYDLELDGRAIFYNPADKELYIKVYGRDLYIVDLRDETVKLVHEGIFMDDQSSPGMTPDGKYLYEYYEDRIRVLDFETGKKVKGFKFEPAYNESGFPASLACSDYYLFAWGSNDEIVVYDLDGNYITEIDMPRDGYGFSLSYCNGLLWIAKDADGSTDGATGYWYGYRL